MATYHLDCSSGIAGDMFLGALVDVGLDKAWLERLPPRGDVAGRIGDDRAPHADPSREDELLGAADVER